MSDIINKTELLGLKCEFELAGSYGGENQKSLRVVIVIPYLTVSYIVESHMVEQLETTNLDEAIKSYNNLP